jgi:hypothetical protein
LSLLTTQDLLAGEMDRVEALELSAAERDMILRETEVVEDR